MGRADAGRPGRRRRLSIAGIGAAVLAAYLTGALQAASRLATRASSDDVRNEISSNLPIGASVAQTRTFLQARGWLDPDTRLTNEPCFTDPETDGSNTAGSFLCAAIQDASPWFIVSGGIFVEFSFDANGRLADYRVRDIYTGP